MTTELSPHSIFFGQMRRDFCILPDGKVLLDTPGGNVLYAATGLMVWEQERPPGIIARVGEDYPREWLELIERKGILTGGIHVQAQSLDVRSFYAYTDLNTRLSDDPVAAFSRLGQELPRALLGFRPVRPSIDSRTQLGAFSLRQSDLVAAYMDAHSAHLCPLDYLTHTLIPAVLRQAGFTTITLDPSVGTMTPVFWDNIPVMLTGLTAFLPSEEEIRALFHGRSTDLWEMAETLGSYGCDFVVIKRGERGQILYDASSKARWEIPAYPARLANLTGAGDAFCGGFLAGYRRTFDPLMAVLHGSIAASITIEGSGPFFALDVLPGLAQARLEALRENARRI